MQGGTDVETHWGVEKCTGRGTKERTGRDGEWHKGGVGSVEETYNFDARTLPQYAHIKVETT